jgi:hypothetical protein
MGNQKTGVRERFYKKVNELSASEDWDMTLSEDSPIYEFGYKYRVKSLDGYDTICTAVDYGNVIKFIEKEIRNAKIEVLEDYTNWLLKNHYVDADVCAEEPQAIDAFLEETKLSTLKEQI